MGEPDRITKDSCFPEAYLKMRFDTLLIEQDKKKPVVGEWSNGKLACSLAVQRDRIKLAH